MHNPSKIRVLLCDDHAVVREGTRRLLEEEPDIEVVGEASDGLEAIEMARKLSPDVIAMDVSMPKMNGIEATRRIKQLSPSVFVLALTAYDDLVYVSSLLEAGASGYILKSVRAQELVAAIRATALGETILDPKVAAQVFKRVAEKRAGPARNDPGDSRDDSGLTAKEIQVLRAAALGRTNKEIAKELSVSPRTVQTHLASIFSKMHVVSRTEAVIKALKTGLLTRDDIGAGDGD